APAPRPPAPKRPRPGRRRSAPGRAPGPPRAPRPRPSRRAPRCRAAPARAGRPPASRPRAAPGRRGPPRAAGWAPGRSPRGGTEGRAARRGGVLPGTSSSRSPSRNHRLGPAQAPAGIEEKDESGGAEHERAAREGERLDGPRQPAVELPVVAVGDRVSEEPAREGEDGAHRREPDRSAAPEPHRPEERRRAQEEGEDRDLGEDGEQRK